MSFFSGRPPVEPEEERTPYERRPSWFGPSEDQVGSPVAVSFVLARTEKVAVVVQAIRAYPDGCLIDLAWVIRRTTEDASQWRRGGDTVFGHGPDPREDGLLLGVALSDGTTASTLDRPDWRTPSDGPRVTQLGGGGGGDTERRHGSTQLWLHPLPPPPTLELVCAWPALGLPETRSTIDAAAIREAAARARFIWPEDAELPVASYE